MATKETPTSKIKIKKKLWYRIIAPQIFGQKEIGETYLSSPEDALGRSMKINLKDLTGNVKDQNIYIDFKVDKIDGSVLKTIVKGYQLAATHVKKMVRKNTDRMDDYFLFKSKDGKEVVIKSIIITSHKTQRSVKKQLRSQLKAFLEKELKENDFVAFVNNLVTRKAQADLRKQLQKVYPLKEATVRVLFLKEEQAAGGGVNEKQADEKQAERLPKAEEPGKESKKERPSPRLEEAKEAAPEKA